MDSKPASRNTLPHAALAVQSTTMPRDCVWPILIAAALVSLTSCQRTTPTAIPAGPYPPALVDFMMQHWAPPSSPRPAPMPQAARFKKRRLDLLAALPQWTLIIPSGHPRRRSADQFYPFRPGTDFYYLTGNPEPDGVLVMWRGSDGDHVRMFVTPRQTRRDARFFTDKLRGELWVGARDGINESRDRYDIDTASLDDLPAALAAARQADRVAVLRDLDAAVDAALPAQSDGDQLLGALLAEQRLRKDTFEIDELRTACNITRRGFEDVIAALPEAPSERALQAAFLRRTHAEGNDPGYEPVVAAAAHGTILHWTGDRGALPKTGLLLLDLGAESSHFYTADITRTVPLTGHFSAVERQVYDAVLAAQDAAFAAVAPGNHVLEPHRAAMRVLTEHLVRWGILTTSVYDALQPDHLWYRRYTLHAVSHWLGLDVHDCGLARQAAVHDGTLQPGMVLTVEPGLYFQSDDLSVPEALRGIGVRIEDDVLVTETGYTLLSDLPRTPVAIEAWMADIQRAASSSASHRSFNGQRPATAPAR